VTFDRETLGPYLKCERERFGVTLDQIAETTKIKRSLLAALERGDLEKWPSGIFRRAFFRAYTSAIGVDGEALVPEFVRLFPDTSDVKAPEPIPIACPAPALRLTLADELVVVRAVRSHIAAAAIDTAAIGVVAMAAGLVTGYLWPALALVAIIYHAVATVRGGRAVGARVGGTTIRPQLPHEAAIESRAARPEPRRGVAGLEIRRTSRSHHRAAEPPIARGTHAVS